MRIGLVGRSEEVVGSRLIFEERDQLWPVSLRALGLVNDDQIQEGPAKEAVGENSVSDDAGGNLEDPGALRIDGVAEELSSVSVGADPVVAALSSITVTVGSPAHSLRRGRALLGMSGIGQELLPTT